MTTSDVQAMISNAIQAHEQQVSRQGYLLFGIVLTFIALILAALFIQDYRLLWLYRQTLSSLR
ncbi:hypothetical protein [Chroococcidiopsis sp.]|uniref:hypothetical protein n=1 Tax=Chroococcidiopsis sp. TaxID=3088168 RepID=UPI003F3AB020